MAVDAGLAFAAPKVIWWSDPVKPGEAVEVFGTGFRLAKVRVDGKPVPVDKTTETGLYFTLPKNLGRRVAEVMLIGSDGLFTDFIVNNPKVKWLQGEEGGESVHPGDKLRIFGRNLKIGRPVVTLGGRELKLLYEDEWSLSAEVPADMATGVQEVKVANGESEFASGGTIEVKRRVPFWKETVFDVTKFGADGRDLGDDTGAVKAALAAAEKNGGGVVFFPPGRFQLRETIRIPEHTLVKGAGRNLTSVYWPDTDYPPIAYVVAKSDFGLEDIFFHTGYYDSFLVVDYDPDAFRRDLYYKAGVVCENITIRRCVFRFVNDQYFSWRKELADRRTAYREGRGIYIRNVRNCIIEDNDMDCSRPGMPFIVQGYGVRIARNRFTGEGWTNFNGEKVIFEDNESERIGHSIGCIAKGVFVGRNHLRMRLAGDRELITHDGRLCAFMQPPNGRWEGMPTKGRLNSPTELEVFPECKVPWYRGTNFWITADVSVASGPGLGQIRRIRDIVCPNRIVLDRPFDIRPTAESRFQVTFQRKDLIYVDNVLEDATIGIQLYGGSYDGVVARNRTNRCGGLTAFGMTYYGYIPVWFTQFLDNVIEGGNQTRMPDPDGDIMLPKDAWLGTWSRPADVPRKLTRATVIRNNRLEGNARIISYSHDGIIENNVVRHSSGSVEYGSGQETVLERGNLFEGARDERTHELLFGEFDFDFLVERGSSGEANHVRATCRSEKGVIDFGVLENLRVDDVVTATAHVRVKRPLLFGLWAWGTGLAAKYEEACFRRLDDKEEPVPMPRYGRVPRLWPAGDYELRLRFKLAKVEPRDLRFRFALKHRDSTEEFAAAIIPLPPPEK